MLVNRKVAVPEGRLFMFVICKNTAFYTKLLVILELEMDEYPPEIFVILLNTMVQFLDMSLVQEAQDLFLELAASLPRDYLDKCNFLFDCFFHNTIKFRVNMIAAVVNVVQVEFEFGHGVLAMCLVELAANK
jgi:hypothetical protein